MRNSWLSDAFSTLEDAFNFDPQYSPSLPLIIRQASPTDTPPVEIPSTPALTSEAAEASAAQSGPVTPLTMTTGGITINLLYDAAAMAAPQWFRDDIQQAASILTASISDKITVNIKIDYSGTGGGAAAGPDNGKYVSYSSVRSYLVNNATPGDATFNALSGGTSIQGQSNVAVWNAQLKLWGLLGANDTTTDDGSATFATDINSNLLVGVALHELTHAMGRVPYGPSPDVFDLFRFTSAGTRLFSSASTAPAAYFSLDGGNTKLADFGQNSDPSDFLNSGVQGANDPFNEYYTGNSIQGLTAIDLKQLDALGFHLAVNSPTVIESFGFTSLVQTGSNYFMDPTSGGGGPSLKYGGTSVVVGQFGAWTPIGVEQISGGDEVAWKNTSTGQFVIWNTDSAGNQTSSAGAYSSTSTALEQAEISFHQDLNGDGMIGVPAPVSGTALESFGSTSLVQSGTNYYLVSAANGIGPELMYSGAPIVSGQFGAWTPIGAEQISGGYEVAFKNTSTGQYVIWDTDANGNQTSSAGPYAAADTALEQAEASFHQDLNGDGTIGAPSSQPSTTIIESLGATSLVQVGSNYYLNPVAGGSGPSLKYSGSMVVAGQFGTWTPIGGEQTSGGYELAFKNTSTDQYVIWNTDSNGNQMSSAGPYAATSTGLEQAETSLHQDLNKDGIIGAASGGSSAGEPSADAFLFRPAPSFSPESKNSSPSKDLHATLYSGLAQYEWTDHSLPVTEHPHLADPLHGFLL